MTRERTSVAYVDLIQKGWTPRERVILARLVRAASERDELAAVVAHLGALATAAAESGALVGPQSILAVIAEAE